MISISFYKKKDNFNFGFYEIPPSIYEFSDNNNILDNIITASVSFHEITMKSTLKANNILRFDIKSFLNTKLLLTRNWDYKPSNEYISQNKINISAIANFHLERDCLDGSI